MTHDEAQAVLERALSAVSAETAVVRLSGNREQTTRFANNAITQNVSADRRTLSVTAAFGQKVGTATTNQMDAESIQKTVRRAEAAAHAADPDLEYLPPLPPQTYPSVGGYAESTACANPADRARIVAAVTRGPAGAGDRAAGSITTTESFMAVANSAGLRAYHRGTSAKLIATVIADGASGWAGMRSYDITRIPVEEIAERAWRKAREARNPEEVPAAPTTVVLEPQATADMLAYMLWSMDAKAADEGRNAFTGLEGKSIAAPLVTIRSQPGNPDVPGAPFADNGAATGDVDWIRDGVLKNLETSRFWAQKTGRPCIDFPGNILMDGSDATTEDLISRVEDGLLVTRFWYIRSVDPMKLLLTGMTRDGLFRIRDGKVVGSARNMRFNESPIRMLAGAVAAGKPVPTRDEIMAPPLLVNGFHFTSVSPF